MPIVKQTANSQVSTKTADTTETTIVTADPNFSNVLTGLIITMITNAAVATCTLRDATGGTIRAVFDYPPTAAVPLQPFIVAFDPPLQSGKNQNWTMQISANAGTTHVTAMFDSL
jgi:hypothetical protein